MNRHPRYDATEVRGRLLYHALVEEAHVQTGAWLSGEPVTLPPELTVPPVSLRVAADTAPMQAIQIA